MKKLVSILLALTMVFALGAMAGCGEEETEGRTFTVGFDAEFPPYGYKDSETGEYTGFDLEVAEELCNRLGWTLVKQPIDWDAKDSELNSGTIDCIWNGFTVNGREDLYTFSNAYVNNTQVVVVKADSGIETLADLAGKNVAVQTESSAQACLEDAQAELAATFASLDVEKEYNTCFMNLEAGAVDAIAMDIGVAEYQIAEREEGAYVMLEETLSSEQYAIAFKLGNEELRDEVQACLNEIIKDGTFETIAEKYGIEDMIITEVAE